MSHHESGDQDRVTGQGRPDEESDGQWHFPIFSGLWALTCPKLGTSRESVMPE